jgi:maltooligosyltrehalose trehalohydrolase
MANAYQPGAQAAPPAVARLGAEPTAEGTWFRVWTTQAKQVEVVIYGEGNTESRREALRPCGTGLFELKLPDVGAGCRYKFALDGDAYPDPYARFMPDGVHGPSMVVDQAFAWRHEPVGMPIEQMAIYELHIGTFTPEGTFEAAQARLGHLKALGVTAIEVMPIAAFPGSRGWGYDGVAAFAPYAPYGKPEDVKAFVDAAHGHGLAVILDVVYNHFGPDGNYLYAYSPKYFTRRHMTPWGDAIDYTNPYMRRLILDSASMWLRDYRFDGLRLDATHHIVDESRTHILEALVSATRELQPARVLIAEDDRNEPALVTAFGLDGLWADDFHHQLRVLLTGERDGYYAAYRPDPAELARVIRRGWLYEGQPWPLSGRARGASAERLAPASLVYTIQNHDQIGNRALGDRLSARVGTEGYLAATALMLFLPTTPLLFQGQEWGATTPFCYFSDHHGELGRAVSEGRAKEFSHFEAFRSGQETIPDPQAERTFLDSKLDWDEARFGDHARVLAAYRQLLRLRREDAVLSAPGREGLDAGVAGDVLWVRRERAGQVRYLLVNFGETTSLDALPLRLEGFTPLYATGAADGQLARHGAVILEGGAA